MKFRKCMSFILAASLVASLGLCGCGDKKVDYSLDDETGDTDATGQGVLATNLGIPESYEGEINVGNSGLTGITINASNIKTPDGDSMDYVTCVENEFDSDYKKQICEALFDTDEGVYVYDEEHQLDEDIQIQIDYYQGLLDSAVSLGDTDCEEIYQSYLDELEMLSYDAVTELSAAGDYSADEYLGYIDGKKYLIRFTEQSDEYGNTWPEFTVIYYPGENLINERPYKDAEQVNWTWTTEYSEILVTSEDGETTAIDSDENICSRDDAVSDAMDLLGRLGIEDVTIMLTSVIDWNYTDAVDELIYTELDGYAFDCTRSVAGEGALIVMATENETKSTGTGASVSSRIYNSYNETYLVAVSSDGIAYLSADFVLTEEEREQNVDLISWDELLQILNDEAGSYFTENKPDYSEVEFNDVRLAYMLIKDPDDGTYNYTPVWYLAQSYIDEESESGYEELYPEVYMIINAMDGTIYSFEDVFLN